MVDSPAQLAEKKDPVGWSDDRESIVGQGGDGVEEAYDAALDEDLGNENKDGLL